MQLDVNLENMHISLVHHARAHKAQTQPRCTCSLVNSSDMTRQNRLVLASKITDDDGGDANFVLHMNSERGMWCSGKGLHCSCLPDIGGVGPAPWSWFAQMHRAKCPAASKPLRHKQQRHTNSFLLVSLDHNDTATRREINAHGCAFFGTAAGLGRHWHPKLEVMPGFTE
jgi:hypothetical protein